MPAIRYITSLATQDASYVAGEVRHVDPEQAQHAVAQGVAELVTDAAPETPERTRIRRTGRPETRTA